MYKPPKEILYKYADLMINFALRGGKGLQPGETVVLNIPEAAKDFLIPLHEAIIKAGGYPILNYLPNGVEKNFFDHANEDQLAHYPKDYYKGMLKQCTHRIRILAEHDPKELKNIDTAKISQHIQAMSPFKDTIRKKSLNKEGFRTLCLYGTPAMAKEACLSLEEYRKQIIKACYLDKKDPVAERKNIEKELNRTKNKLTKLKIESVHITGKETDLHIKIGSNRQWLSGGGNNIPSFEVFTSPDRRGTEGWIKFSQPLYRYGQLIEGIELEFKNGEVSNFKAKTNQKFLEEIFKIPNAKKLGEFSLTDKRLSRITKFMAHTLFDENVGGKFGNTHVAIGGSFKDAYFDTEQAKRFKSTDRKKLGFNQCAEHIDIMSTSDRTVTATLSSGQQKIIYKDGQFTV